MRLVLLTSVMASMVCSPAWATNNENEMPASGLTSGLAGAYSSWAESKDQSLGVSYQYSDVDSRNRNLTLNSLSLDYSKRQSTTQTDIYFINGISSDFDAAPTSTDSRGLSLGYGQRHIVGEGLSLSGVGFVSVNNSDINTLTSDANSKTAGVSVALTQVIPLSQDLLASVGAAVSPRYTHSSRAGNSDDYVAYTFTPAANLYYILTPKVTLGSQLEYSISNRDITLDRGNSRYRVGVGAQYKFDEDYTLQMRYKRELASHQHGDIVGINISRHF